MRVGFGVLAGGDLEAGQADSYRASAKLFADQSTGLDRGTLADNHPAAAELL
jgi:hypothetical protein